MQPNNPNENQQPSEPLGNAPQPEFQQNNTPKQVNYMGVLKNPFLIVSVIIFVVLYIFGMLQSNEDLKTYLSIPLFALTPIIIGALIIKESTKKK